MDPLDDEDVDTLVMQRPSAPVRDTLPCVDMVRPTLPCPPPSLLTRFIDRAFCGFALLMGWWS
jgi:hypothetical protein